MYNRLDPLSFALAGGLTFGFAVLVLTIVASISGYGVNFLHFFYFYPHYTISMGGAPIGFIWAFVDGFVAFAFFAWIYNNIRHHHGVNEPVVGKKRAITKKK